MSDSRDNKVLELYLESIQKSVDRVDVNMGKLFEKSDDMNSQLSRHGALLKQSNEKVDKLEDMVQNQGKTIQDQALTITELKSDYKKLDSVITNDLKPVAEHVQNLENSFSWIKSLPVSVKVVVSIIVGVASVMGIYGGWGSLVSKLVK